MMISYHAMSGQSEYQAYNEGYQQGRVDAINEFVERHNKCNTNLCDKVGKGISCCECIAEHLKEKKYD